MISSPRSLGSRAPIQVSVPATSANLGPGFDCLGVALGVTLRVRFSPSDRPGLGGKGRIREVKDSLIYRSFVAAFSSTGEDPPPVEISVVDDYPSGRGMGASASAIVAGLSAANAFGDLGLSDDQLALLAVEIEGHADNVLPALFGGLVLTVGDSWTRMEPSNQLAPLILVARTSFKTKAARKVVPEVVTRQDAVSNASALAALLSILSGNPDRTNLLAATEDRLHEPYRLPLMPESLDLHKALRDRGIPTTLSGAGPSLISLVESDRLEDAVILAQGLLPDGWRILRPGWDLEGAQVLPV